MQISILVKLGVFAVICAISAAFSYAYYTEVTEAQDTVDFLIVDPSTERPPQLGVSLDADMIEDIFATLELPADLANEDDGQLSWALKDTAAARLGLQGLVLANTLQPGDFVRPEDFVAQPDDILARRVDSDKRAFSITVRPGSAVETFLAPGSDVDVMLTSIGEDDVPRTETLMTNVQLLAVGRFQSMSAYVESGRPTYTSLTVQAPPEQIAAFLDKTLGTRGNVTVVLRRPVGIASNE